MAWYEEWFGEEYLELYSHRDESEAEAQALFAEGLVSQGPGGPILDLACGAGRHTRTMNHRGLPAFGVDLSTTLLAQKSGWPRAAGDMRSLPFPSGVFSWVVNFFTSFGYFPKERENFRVLEEVTRLLRPGGFFLLDLMNPEPTLQGLREKDQKTLGNREVAIRRWYDQETRRLNKEIRLVEKGMEERIFMESVRLYSRDEVVIGLRWAGLEVVQVLGSFRGESHSRESERLITVSEKRA